MVHLPDIRNAAFVAFGAVLALPRLHGVPEIVIEDAQFRRFLNDPFGFRVGPGLPLAGIRVFDEALTIPDDLAHIHLVVEDAVATLRIAVDRAEAPIAARRGGNAIPVQGEGDGLGRLAGGIVAEDAAHDLGLSFVDRAIAADRFAVSVQLLHHVIAVGVAAARLARLDPAALPAPGLVGQILQEQRVHRAFQADMQMRDFTLGEGEHLHARIGHALEEARYVLLIA